MRHRKLSLAVRPLDGIALAGGKIQFAIGGQPREPIYHREGYWLFLDLPAGTHTLIWQAERYEGGQRVVDLAGLPSLRPVVEVMLSRRP